MTSVSTFPYPPRPGTNLENIDLNESSQGLGDRLGEVIEFEHQLYAAQLDPNVFPSAEAYRIKANSEGVDVSPLESVWNLKVNSSELGVSYFLTEDGKAGLESALGTPGDYDDEESCVSFISSLDISDIKTKTLDKLRGDSVRFEEQKLTNLFIDNDFNGEYLPAPNLVTVFKNPEVLLSKLQGYKKFKGYINAAMRDLSNVDSMDEVTRAKMLLADLYKQRINVFIADSYVSAYKLGYQSSHSRNNIHGDIVSQLDELMPAFFSTRQNEAVAGFLQRLDRLTNGVSRDEDNRLTWLSAEAKALIKDSDDEEDKVESVDRGIYAEIDVEKLKNTIINSKTRGDWASFVLSEHGLLSEYTDWDSDRTTHAQDGKWQAVVSNAFDNLAVNDKQGVFKVPDESATILDAVTKTNHEETHVFQNENKRVIGNLAILERVGLDNPSCQKESGGIWQERVAKEKLTGVVDRDIAGTSYYQALLVKSRGGSFGECAQAYFEDLSRREPAKESSALAATAINRTRRIFRSGGLEFAQNTSFVTNTEPLNYLEQSLVYERLSEPQRKLLFVGGVAIHNLVRLSEHGLVDVTKIWVPDKMPVDLLFPLVEAELSRQAALES